jgi:hypothetical protein
MRKLTLFIFLAFLVCGIVCARNKPPLDVEPAIFYGVKYTVDHHGKIEGKEQNGGYVKAWDMISGKLLWERQVYATDKIRKNFSTEEDVYITGLYVKDGILYVRDEQDDMFAVLLSYPDKALDAYVEKPCEIEGIALNVKQGAIVRVANSIVFIDGLDSWPKGFEGNVVVATGKMKRVDVIPEERCNPAALTDVAGFVYMIESGNWDLKDPSSAGKYKINDAFVPRM